MDRERTLEEGTFELVQELTLNSSREVVFGALLDPNSWWRADAGAPGRVVLEARVGGRFYHEEGDDGWLWGTVSLIRRPERLRLTGPLAMDTPVSSVWEYELEEREGGGTVLRLIHRCVGLMNPKWRAAHERGWEGLLERLRDHVERRAGRE